MNEEDVDESERIFNVVFIPASVSENISDVQVKQDKGKAFEAMTSFCKLHFSSIKSKLDSSGMDILKKQIMSQAGKDASISDDLIERLATMTTCEIVPLYPNSTYNGFVAINMYVDDKGVAKGLEFNPRATAIAQACGLDMNVCGDAFIAKQFDNDRGFYRIDFTTKELDSEAGWVKKAKAFNLKKKSESGGVSGPTIHNLSSTGSNEKVISGLLSQADKNRVEALKKEGNDLFAKQQYHLALQKYAECLAVAQADVNRSDEMNKIIAATLCNRSLVYFKMGDFASSLAEAEKCVSVDPKYVKGWGRIGDAYLALNNQQSAKASFQKALELEPTNPELQKRLSTLG